jgi:tight adherence protein B
VFLFVAFLIFSGALFAAAYYVWTVPQKQESEILAGRLREVRARTGAKSRSRTASDIMIQEERGAFARVGDFFLWLGPIRRLQDIIEQANLAYRAGDVLALSLLVVGLSYLILGIFGGGLLLLRLLVALILGAVPVAWIFRVRGKRLRRFEEMLPDAIDLFNRSMRAGHNIQAGLETVAAETVDPVKMEFRRVVEELALGSQIEAALHNLGKRVPLIDLKFFITGLILQRQTGANMVNVLENLSALIRERLNLAAKLKAATTQQRFSAGILCALPVIVGVGFWFLKPEYIRLLYTDETGTKFLTAGIVLEVIGIIAIRKISNPKF